MNKFARVFLLGTAIAAGSGSACLANPCNDSSMQSYQVTFYSSPNLSGDITKVGQTGFTPTATELKTTRHVHPVYGYRNNIAIYPPNLSGLPVVIQFNACVAVSSSTWNLPVYGVSGSGSASGWQITPPQLSGEAFRMQGMLNSQMLYGTAQ